MEKKNSQTIKGDNNTQNITYNVGIQRDEVINIIKNYCYTDKEQIIDIIKEVMDSIEKENGRMPEKRIFIPILQQLSVSLDDECIKQTYKQLLKSSMSSNKNVHPSFVTIVNQLNSDEIKILNSLPPVTIHYMPLLNVRLKNGIQKGDGIMIIRNFSNVGFGVCDNPENIGLYIDNLERLKLIEIPPFKTLLNKEAYQKLKEHPNVVETINRNGAALPSINIEYDERCFLLTQFGVEFIEACK